MNLRRMVTLGKILKHDLEEPDVPGTLNKLAKQLKQAIDAPNEDNQRAVEDTYRQLLEALASAQSNFLSPALRVDLDELRVSGGNSSAVVSGVASQAVGKGLSERLQEAFDAGPTSVRTLDTIRNLQTEVTKFRESLTETLTGLQALGVTGEELEPGESLVGLTVPRHQAKTLEAVQKEMSFFGHLIDTAAECADGHVIEKPVATLRSSDFGFDVKTNIEVANIISLIAKGVKFALDKLRGFRELKKKAEELGANQAVLAEIEASSNESMEAAISEIQTEVMQHCALDDDGRVNELSTKIKFCINGVANRVERGFTFEVRTELPKQSTEQQQQMGENIAALTKIDFRPVDGPLLLQLPEEPGAETQATKAHGKQAAKKKVEKTRRIDLD